MIGTKNLNHSLGVEHGRVISPFHGWFLRFLHHNLRIYAAEIPVKSHEFIYSWWKSHQKSPLNCWYRWDFHGISFPLLSNPIKHPMKNPMNIHINPIKNPIKFPSKIQFLGEIPQKNHPEIRSPKSQEIDTDASGFISPDEILEHTSNPAVCRGRSREIRGLKLKRWMELMMLMINMEVITRLWWLEWLIVSIWFDD